MTDDEKIETVTRKLLGGWTGIYDNPITQRREFWKDGFITHERMREFCTGVAHSLWGTYKDKPIYD